MLVLCYGIPKSGSTLAFELVQGVLESAGHPQIRLPGMVVSPQHSVNFLQAIDREKISRLLEYTGKHWATVKTHSKIDASTFSYIEDLQNARRLQVIASYRDPREICLSLADAGANARSRGVKPFAGFVRIDDAVPAVLRQTETFRRWGALSRTLRLGYDTVAFAPDDAIDRIERCLRIKSDRERAKRYAFVEARTQKNKALQHRAKTELTEEQYARLTTTFSEFIQNACETDNESWFSAVREQVMAKSKPHRRPSTRRR